MPTRDVDVTYEMQAGDRTATERLRWLVASALLRVDPPGQGVYMITDYKQHRVSIVQTESRTVAVVPAPAAAIPGAPDAPHGKPFQRNGESQVAGLACTQWSATDTEGRPVGICMTDDGVMLRLQSGGRTVLQARSVTYGPQDASAFEVPADYRRTTPFGQ